MSEPPAPPPGPPPDDGLPPSTPPPAPAKGPRLTRRRFFGVVGLGMAGGAWWAWRIAPSPRLQDLRLSDAARALVKEAWEGLDPALVVDAHCHTIGLGIGDTGCFVHPDSLSMASPVRLLKTRIYKGAAGIHDDGRADALFVERLFDLLENQAPRCRAVLLAFDAHHRPDGTRDLGRTEFHTPNDYVLDLAARRPDLALAACSVHPYRKDALEELSRCAARGAKLCKWLPNAMGMDPADPRCDAFYERLAALGLPLLTHAGEEQAVHAEEAQELGNPLRLRRALERGATVIVAHCASLGTSKDLDAPVDPATGDHPRVSSYRLFRRLLDEPRWAGKLFGDISATTQFNRCEEVLADLLSSPGIHGRLVNGSDYPLPAIDPLIRTGLLVDLGLLESSERDAVNELYAYNPLIFDLVLKRRLRVVKDGVTHRFAPSVFESGRLLPG